MLRRLFYFPNDEANDTQLSEMISEHSFMCGDGSVAAVACVFCGFGVALCGYWLSPVRQQQNRVRVCLPSLSTAQVH